MHATRISDTADQIWRLVSTGDLALADQLAEDVTLRASGTSHWSGTYTGRNQVLAYLNELITHFPNQSLELRDTLTSDRRIAYLVGVAIERDGHVVNDESIWVMTVDRGLIVDWELNDSDQYAMDEFWNLFPESASRLLPAGPS
ncbi:MAG: nuclear transport factor 2 family protein [Actinomycetota bacterium]|nr:nuclear transport factor 2 family protein [Actinomycetota bacterium]